MTKPLPRERIEQILTDLRYEPAWRAEAAREADFYDGNQLDTETMQRMRELGIAPIVVNLIRPTIDTVLGLEARTRTDPIVRGEDDQATEVAEALNVKLQEAVRLARFNTGCSEAHESQVKVGIGWLEVSRESDPFKYPYRVQAVHRDEIWFDYRSRDPMLRDARYLVRKRWYDADDLEGHFPRHKRLIRQSVAQRPAWDDPNAVDVSLGRSWEIEQTTSLQEEEWLDTERHRLALYEVWYRVHTDMWVLDLPDGRVVELNREDRRHLNAVAAGLVTPRKARSFRLRVAYYLGPHQLADRPSPYTHGHFPYVPFFGYREDRSGAPYGLIRAMKSPQEEVNARRSKMLYNLSTRRVIADRDAVDDHAQAAQEVARSDAYIITNPSRQNANGFNVDTDARLNPQQFEVMQEAKQNIQDASGLFHEMMGRGAGSGQSGEAIKSLVEQGQQVLGKIIENYQDGRRLAAELLMSMLVEDLGQKTDLPVRVESVTGEVKDVLLNHPEHDELGYEYRTNDILKLRTQVALDETPSSTTYRQHLLARMMELTQTLPPELQAAVMDIIIEASDLPNRKEFVERIRAVTGMGGGSKQPQTEEEALQAQQQAEAEQRQAEMQQQAAELELREREARVRDLEARAEKAMADAQRAIAMAQKTAGVDTEHQAAQTAKTISEIERGSHEDMRAEAAQHAELFERGARLRRDEQAAAQQTPEGPRHGPPPSPQQTRHTETPGL
ncbi:MULTISPECIES: hypothetical protein [Halorhodospira]|uniref:portal protein n=1 Tax=Halorhodospira TaxID=85108 RepID=UPI001EE8765A|nr:MULTISPECIES: hypothetical protein [Halorhodospira]MCG5526851.1 hypothetical protein [Halorhodospira halophila]MCG5542812.1 hypothetical protein [Halorhodospira sp. 9628]